MSSNLYKLIGISVICVCLTVLMAFGAAPSEACLPIITLLVGLLAGNGISAAQGNVASPIISPSTRRRKQVVIDLEGDEDV